MSNQGLAGSTAMSVTLHQHPPPPAIDKARKCCTVLHCVWRHWNASSQAIRAHQIITYYHQALCNIVHIWQNQTCLTKAKTSKYIKILKLVKLRQRVARNARHNAMFLCASMPWCWPWNRCSQWRIASVQPAHIAHCTALTKLVILFFLHVFLTCKKTSK